MVPCYQNFTVKKSTLFINFRYTIRIFIISLNRFNINFSCLFLFCFKKTFFFVLTISAKLCLIKLMFRVAHINALVYASTSTVAFVSTGHSTILFPAIITLQLHKLYVLVRCFLIENFDFSHPTEYFGSRESISYLSVFGALEIRCYNMLLDMMFLWELNFVVSSYGSYIAQYRSRLIVWVCS